MVPNKLVNGVIKSSVKQNDEIRVYNSPYTVNVQQQISIKHSAKVAIVSNSHLKGCTMEINNHLGDTFRITGWTKPGALAEELLDKPIMDLVDLNKQDVVVISAGENDLYMNNCSVALLKITKFIQNNCNTNMIIYGVPHRYDLAEYSCVNRAIGAFNCKLKKVATLFKHVTLLQCNCGREYFTNHGMHLNGRGKRRGSKQLAPVISKLTAVEAITPISLGWIVDHDLVMSNNVTTNETEILGNDGSMKEPKDEADTQITEDQHVKMTGGVSSDLVESVTSSKDNNVNILTKSRRPRKAPIVRSNVFLW